MAASGRVAQWGQAFTGESFIWIFGIAELVLALTLNTRLSLIVFALGFAAHFLVLGRLRKHAAEAAPKT
ncbi:MAG: hypothetical protein H0X40_11210 [Chthoniobacterales bacterium]|nr:hypothetical protein [Chthoniobacterales bacterium]